MSIIEPILAEFEQEAKSTRKMLEMLPEEKFVWKPHEKSMSLGRLATHIAELPSWAGTLLIPDEFDMGAAKFEPRVASSVAEVLVIFDKNVPDGVEVMKGQSDERLMAIWKLKKGGEVFVEMSRITVFHTMILNHMIHHRGQLSVYLRMHDVPLPAVYGPTADQRM